MESEFSVKSEFFGRNGQVLQVDLSRGKVGSQAVGKDVYDKFVGGTGLGMALVYHKALKVDSLAPESPLAITIGPFSGAITGSGSVCCTAKSPLTETLFDSTAQGHFGPELKLAGWDGIVVTGRASKPAYLCIRDGQAEIFNAQDLWGRSTTETEAILTQRHQSARVLSIGPAGENQVKFASIHSASRTFGRGGLGAVLGSKNFKAIVVEGNIDIPAMANSDALVSLRHEITAFISQGHEYLGYEKFGTRVAYEGHLNRGGLSAENFQRLAKAADLEPAEIIAGSNKTGNTCFQCQVGCSRKTNGNQPAAEFETLALLGANISISNLTELEALNQLCNQLGLDTLSTGAAMAFYQECAAKGIIEGNLSVFDLIQLIANQDGIGQVLAQGTNFAAKMFDNGSEQFLTTVKGLSVPAYDPRMGYGLALAYCIGPNGANHRKAFYSPETKGQDDGLETRGKAVKVARKAIGANSQNCLGLCKWGAGNWQRQAGNLAKLSNAVLGEDISGGLDNLGRRILTMHRLFNQRQGYGIKDDMLPPRFFKPRFDGDLVLDKAVLQEMVIEYYQAMGWDQAGWPLPKTIEQLGLEEFV